MKCILNSFLYYFSWHGIIRLNTSIGLVLLALAFLVKISGGAYPGGLLLAGCISLFLVSNALAPFMFRLFLFKNQYYLVPGLRTGMAAGLFLLALTTSLLISLIAAGYGTSVVGLTGIKLGLYLFIVISTYFGVVQVSFNSWKLVILLAWIPWAMIQLAWQFPDRFLELFDTPWLLAVVTLLTLAGWAWGYILLRRQVLFSYARPVPDNSAPYQSQPWFEGDKLGVVATVSGTLLGGAPDGRWATLMRSLVLAVIIPLIPASISAMIGLFTNPENLRPAVYVYMAFCAALTGLPPASLGEMAARTRLLWLRWGSDRNSHWRHLEFNLLRNLAYTFTLVIVISVVILVPLVDNVLALNLPVFVLCLALFNTYLGLCSRIYRWPGLLTGLIIAGTFIFMILPAFEYMVSATLGQLHLQEGLLFLIALLCRYIAKRGFLEIDWLQVKPALSRRVAH